jgi:hypothetical protein
MYGQPNGASPAYNGECGLAPVFFSRSLSFSSLPAFVFHRFVQCGSFPSYSLFVSHQDSSEMWIGGVRRVRAMSFPPLVVLNEN